MVSDTLFSTEFDAPRIPGLWAPIEGTPDFHCVVDGQAYICRYIRTVVGHGRGYGLFKTHEAEVKNPTQRTALVIGGRSSAVAIRSYKRRYG